MGKGSGKPQNSVFTMCYFLEDDTHDTAALNLLPIRPWDTAK